MGNQQRQWAKGSWGSGFVSDGLDSNVGFSFGSLINGVWEYLEKLVSICHFVVEEEGLERPAEMQASQAATSPRRRPELGLGPERERQKWVCSNHTESLPGRVRLRPQDWVSAEREIEALNRSI